MHPASRITSFIFFFFYHVSLSEDVDATGVSAKSCYRILKCRKKELTSETTQMNA